MTKRITSDNLWEQYSLRKGTVSVLVIRTISRELMQNGSLRLSVVAFSHVSSAREENFEA